MDKFRVVVIALGTLIIVTFSFYNFGYYITPSVPQSGAEISPVSSFDSVTNPRTAGQTNNLRRYKKQRAEAEISFPICPRTQI